MFVWAKSSRTLPRDGLRGILQDAHQGVPRGRGPPGLGFGHYGDDHVRFALIENKHRTAQAIRGLKKVIEEGEGC